jgi:hypothetical protein
MGTPLRQLGPSEAFEDSASRSIAGAAAGLLVSGCIQAALPTTYRESLIVPSSMLAAFLMTLTVSLAYYHRRWKLGVVGALLSLILPFAVNVLWARFSGRSLLYPIAALGLAGTIVLWKIHREMSGPRWDGDIDDEMLEKVLAEMDSDITWKQRVTWICFISAAILVLIFIFR